MKNVFLLDDDNEELSRLKLVLEEELQVRTLPVSDSAAAMEIITAHAHLFSAYVLDIEMVGQKYSGIQIAEHIRRQPGCALVPIIFLTSYSHFGAGSLHYIHYYDFFQKPCSAERMVRSVSQALSIDSPNTPPSQPPTITFETNRLCVELNLADVSCIELLGSYISVTDLLGEVTVYRVRSNVFSSICYELDLLRGHSLMQIHRSIIINVNRIKEIIWQKNTATVHLFNVAEPKPAGKTFLHNLSIYAKQPSYP